LAFPRCIGNEGDSKWDKKKILKKMKVGSCPRGAKKVNQEKKGD